MHAPGTWLEPSRSLTLAPDLNKAIPIFQGGWRHGLLAQRVCRHSRAHVRCAASFKGTARRTRWCRPWWGKVMYVSLARDGDVTPGGKP